MEFWLFMLVMDLLIPGTMIALGIHYRGGATRPINRISGFRTPRSMASPAAWDYAHRLSGRIWLWAGIALLPASVAAMLALLGELEGTVSLWGAVLCFGQLGVLSLSILPVEIALHRAFDENGEPRRTQK